MSEGMIGGTSPEYLVDPREGYRDTVSELEIRTYVSKDNADKSGSPKDCWYVDVYPLDGSVRAAKIGDEPVINSFSLRVGFTDKISQDFARWSHLDAKDLAEIGLRGKDLMDEIQSEIGLKMTIHEVFGKASEDL